MKSVLQQKKEELTAKLERSVALKDILEVERRAFNEEEKTEAETLVTDIKNLKEEIRSMEKLTDVANFANVNAGSENQRDLSQADKRNFDNYSLLRGLRMAQNTPNHGEDNGIEREFHQEFLEECRSLGLETTGHGSVGIPHVVLRNLAEKRFANEKRTQTITGDSGTKGGALVVDQVDPNIVRLFRNLNILTEIGLDVRTGLKGTQKIKKEGSYLTATWEGETTTIPASDKTYSSVDFAPKRIGATTGYSSQSLVQSNWNMESELMTDLFSAIDDKLNDTVFNGTGSGNVPNGILTAAGTTALALGTDGAALTRKKVYEFQALIDDLNAKVGNLSYISNTRTRYALMNTLLDAGSGRFVMERENELAGFRYHATNWIPRNLTKGTGTNLSAMIFGDMSQMRVGQWGGIELVIDPYTAKKESITEITIHSFWNMLLVRPSSFVVCKDIVTAI